MVQETEFHEPVLPKEKQDSCRATASPFHLGPFRSTKIQILFLQKTTNIFAGKMFHHLLRMRIHMQVNFYQERTALVLKTRIQAQMKSPPTPTPTTKHFPMKELLRILKITIPAKAKTSQTTKTSAMRMYLRALKMSISSRQRHLYLRSLTSMIARKMLAPLLRARIADWAQRIGVAGPVISGMNLDAWAGVETFLFVASFIASADLLSSESLRSQFLPKSSQHLPELHRLSLLQFVPTSVSLLLLEAKTL